MSARKPPRQNRPVRSATELSDPALAETWNLAQLPWLARASLYLAVVMMLGGPSCLVTSSPEFHQPPSESSAPFLCYLKPDTHEIIVPNKVSGTTPSYEPGTIYFSVFSDDGVQPVHALVVLDFQTADWKVLGRADIEVGNYDSNTELSSGRRIGREKVGGVTYTLRGDTKPGCHTLTLIVTHEFAVASPKAADPYDSTVATWWLAIEPDPENPTTLLAECAKLAPPVGLGDAGASSVSQ